MAYLRIAALGALVVMVFALNLLWKSNQELKAQKTILEAQIEINEMNVVLLTSLLEAEQKLSEAANNALSELASEVPDVVYSQKLDPAIQGVIDRFNTRVGITP